MKNKKSFLAGLAAGLLLMALIAFGLLQYKQYLLWGGKLEPDAKIREIYSLLDEYSINEYDRDALIEHMYRGLLDGVGDPYTYYFDEASLAVFTEQTEGVYGGVGMEVTLDPEDRLVKILSVYPNAPGDKAGLRLNDKIIKVDGIDVTQSPLEEVTAMTKGKPGAKVTLTVFRESDNTSFDVDIVREVINIPTVSHTMLDYAIGYIRIKGFERVTLDQFSEAYQNLRTQGMQGLIIDLRNNPGGLMDTVTQIADILLPRGTIVYTEDKWGDRKYYYSDDEYNDVPLVLLVNEGSASASEVLCGAVKDMGMGTLVGTKTFGKGIVQNLYNLSDGSAIKITVAKYYTPNGICIHDVGIVPDYVVEQDVEASVSFGALPTDEDAQLQKAIEVVLEKMP